MRKAGIHALRKKERRKGRYKMQISKAKIDEYINQHGEEMVEFLSEVLKVPSVTGDELAVSLVLKKRMERMGLTVETIGVSEDRPNLIAAWQGPQDGPTFLFNGHMDVFPPVPEEAPEVSWSGKTEDGFVHGRGASDMKGGDCAALMAVEMLHALGFEPHGRITLSFMCDEEVGGKKGVKYLIEKGLLRADFGICMEPSNMDLILGHTGIYRCYLKFYGTPASSYRPHPSMDALEKCVLAAEALYRLRDEIQKRKDPVFGCPSLSVTTLHAGTATNVFATEARLSLDRRLIPGETHEQAEREIRDALAVLEERYPEFSYELELISDRPFLQTEPDSAVAKAISRANWQVFGKPVSMRYRHGGSDAASIFEAFGTQIPNIGPGQEAECAKANEKIRIKDYLDMIKIYALTLLELM